MAEPTEKAEPIAEFLDQISNRTEAITQDVCVPSPFGCGRRAAEFRDDASRREFAISGLCQHCQDIIFDS